MTMTLYAIAYVLIGIVAGRAWYTGWHRRNNDTLVPMCAAVGLIWPLVLVGVPVGYVLFKLTSKGAKLLWRTVIGPAGRWSFRQVDKAVALVVPEKAV